MSDLKILIKYPSRGRPERFFDGMDSVYNNLYNTEDFHVSITLDDDDEKMNNADVLDRLKSYPRHSISWGLSTSKVNAINRGMPEYDFDILLVMSDDMRLTFYGWDEIVRQEFRNHGLDILLHIPDQDAKSALATMYIAGRTYYERDGFIYNNEYESLHCDNESHEIAVMRECYRFAPIQGVISHLNPAYGHLTRDEMFDRQQQIGWSKDHQTYIRRKSINFGL